MMAKKAEHWTDDEELLSNFALHKLSAKDEERLSSHLRSCPICQRAVDDETRIVAGIRYAGRLELKHHLRSQLARSKESPTLSAPQRMSGHRIPWARVASLAAVLAIIIAVGVYNRWFESNYTRVMTPHETVQERPSDSVERGKKLATSPEMQREKNIAQSAVTTEEKNRNEKKSVLKVEPLKEKSETRPAGANETLTKSISPSPTVINLDELAAGKGQQAEYEANLGDQAAKRGEQEVWIEGRVISFKAEPSAAIRNAPTMERQDQMKAAAAPRSGMKGEADNLPDRRVNHASIEFAVNQKPLSSLPVTLQYKQKQNARTVQTLIDNSADTVQLTLYLDPPVPESELRAADVQLIGNDSLILTLPNQQISYKLPPSLQGQVNLKAKNIR